MFSYYNGKSVFITGHTGFKGAWLCRILQHAGARITGYSLAPVQGGVYDVIADGGMRSYIGDVRDLNKMHLAFDSAKPEIAFHLAAQPLVLDAYEYPAYTFETNVQGTVNLLECVRQSESVRSVVVVTTDKVYLNNEWEYGYRENDTLGGDEPYSASKACAELVSNAYYETYLRKHGVALSTVRAGNVIGGGDVAKNRIVPDCVRSAKRGEPIVVRNPRSVRPYQHVLEPLFAYLYVAQRQCGNLKLANSYNIGPNETDCITTAELADMFCKLWEDGQMWQNQLIEDAPYESGRLVLSCAKIRDVLGWRPIWDVQTAIAKTIEWEKSADKLYATDKQISEYSSAYFRMFE